MQPLTFRLVCRLCLACAICLSGLAWNDAATAAVRNPSEHYKPRGTQKVEGAIAVGVFTYAPFTQGKVKYADAIYTAGAQNISLNTPIAELVRKNTGYELYHAGVTIDQETSQYALTGEVLELRAEDDGPMQRWYYTVRYGITERQSGTAVYGLTCPRAEARSPRSIVNGDYVPVINTMIFAGYECLIQDQEMRNFIKAK